MQRIVIDPAQLHRNILTLTPAQHHYLVRVLRLQAGQRFIALNGTGQQWIAALPLSDPTPDFQVPIVETLPPPATRPWPSITLVMALPKAGFDEVVRQATELGIAHLQPVLSDRTLLRPSPQKLARWQRIAAEATEQCERPTLPTLHAPIPWSEYLTTAPPGGLLASARRAALPLALAIPHPTPNTLTLALGPEGGWTPAEHDAACARGFLPISLGPHILRAVTAGPAALAMVRATLDTRYGTADPQAIPAPSEAASDAANSQ